MMNEVV